MEIIRTEYLVVSAVFQHCTMSFDGVVLLKMAYCGTWILGKNTKVITAVLEVKKAKTQGV